MNIGGLSEYSSLPRCGISQLPLSTICLAASAKRGSSAGQGSRRPMPAASTTRAIRKNQNSWRRSIDSERGAISSFLVQGQAQRKDRATFFARLCAHAAAVFLGNFLHHREAQARAAGLAGGVGLEPALTETFRQAGTVVGQGQFDEGAAALLDLARERFDMRLAAVADGFERVLDQIVQQLAQAAGIGAHQQFARLEAARDLQALVVLVQVEH